MAPKARIPSFRSSRSAVGPAVLGACSVPATRGSLDHAVWARLASSQGGALQALRNTLVSRRSAKQPIAAEPTSTSHSPSSHSPSHHRRPPRSCSCLRTWLLRVLSPSSRLVEVEIDKLQKFPKGHARPPESCRACSKGRAAIRKVHAQQPAAGDTRHEQHRFERLPGMSDRWAVTDRR